METKPDERRDRGVCAALRAVADVAGGPWPDLIRGFLVGISQPVSKSGRAARAAAKRGERLADDDYRLQVLLDMRLQLEPTDDDGKPLEPLEMKPSRACVESLVAMENRPWARMGNGKPLSPCKLANLLLHFGIRPTTARYRGTPAKVYRRADFVDSWARYATPRVTSKTRVTS